MVTGGVGPPAETAGAVGGTVLMFMFPILV